MRPRCRRRDMRITRPLNIKMDKTIVTDEGSKENKAEFLFNRARKTFIKNNIPVYLYAAILAIAYVFYQLGYSFFYGFYFGGDKDIFQTLDLFVNQVPFDFKLMAIAGASTSVLCLLYYLPIHMYMLSDSIKSKAKWVLFHAISIGAICYFYDIISGMGKHLDSLNEIAGLLLISSAVISGIILVIRISIKSPIVNSFVYFCYAFLIFGLNLIFAQIFNFEVNAHFSSYSSVIAIQFILFNGLVDALINFNLVNSSFIKCTKMIVAGLPFIVVYILILYKLDRNQGQYLILLTLICLVIWLAATKLWKGRRVKKNDSSDTSTPNANNKRGEGRAEFTFVVLMMAILPLALYILCMNIAYKLGDSLGAKTTLSTVRTINYSPGMGSDQSQPIQGVLVAQKGTTYYISTEIRELKVISASEVEISIKNR